MNNHPSSSSVLQPLFVVGTPLIFMALLLAAVLYGWRLQDTHDCLEWKSEAALLGNVFWLTPSQIAQCDSLHVTIASSPAP